MDKDTLKAIGTVSFVPEVVGSNIEICVSDTVTYSTVYVGGFSALEYANDKLKWHTEYVEAFCDDSETLTLQEIADQLEEENPLITVIVTSTLSGVIYQYGNYDDGKWYKIGVTCGYA